MLRTQCSHGTNELLKVFLCGKTVEYGHLYVAKASNYWEQSCQKKKGKGNKRETKSNHVFD